MIAGLRRRALHLTRYRGSAVECPCCGHRFSAFLASGRMPNAMCLRCGSHARHRALCLLLDGRPGLLDGVRDVLHFAPEHPLSIRLSELPGYVSTDLAGDGVMVRADITSLPFESASFDAVVCSHVLEHVPDDAAAIGELFRVLRPGGLAIVMVPADPGRASTYEDPAVTGAAGREREFGQHDHVRVYGRDVEQRLERAGFAVTRESVAEPLDPELRARYGLLGTDAIWLCAKPAASSARDG